jgi:hypothetical protein
MAKTLNPFKQHGSVIVNPGKNNLEHEDGTPFFLLADTCWTGPALSTEAEWELYLADRKRKGFTAIQFNMASPWRTAPTDAEGRISYCCQDGHFAVNEEFYLRMDQRLAAINAAGLLAVPVLCWAHMPADIGKELNEANLLKLIKFEVERYRDAEIMWILAGDNSYTPEEAAMWKRIGRKVFADNNGTPVTTHPTGENWPWTSWEDEAWLNVWSYQSGHGDSEATFNWLHHGPVADYGKRSEIVRPVINLEPPYEGIKGYKSGIALSDYHIRRSVLWSLMITPIAGVTYGGQGVWSWHLEPGTTPVGHSGFGVAEHWNKALDLPGATQMGYIRQLFESLPWTALAPTQELIQQVTNQSETFVTCMATPDRAVIIVYFPIGSEAELLINCSNRIISWFNPRSGVTTLGNLTSPDSENDWVLIVRTK